jgi:3-polyprenyl-4-hydroxybenzoate decarboxylase
MSTPSSAREALLVEMLGEVATLLDRVDALIPVLHDGCETLSRAGADMNTKSEQAQVRIAALVEAASTHAIKHIARKTEAMARTTVEAETQVMKSAAQALFRTELSAALRQLSVAVGHQATLLNTRRRWWALAATAVAASLTSSMLTIFMMTR